MFRGGVDRLVPRKDRVESTFDTFNASMQQIMVVIGQKTCCLFGLQREGLTDRDYNIFEGAFSIVQSSVRVQRYYIYRLLAFFSFASL